MPEILLTWLESRKARLESSSGALAKKVVLINVNFIILRRYEGEVITIMYIVTGPLGVALSEIHLIAQLDQDLFPVRRRQL